jgi:hypothetical protein
VLEAGQLDHGLARPARPRSSAAAFHHALKLLAKYFGASVAQPTRTDAHRARHARWRRLRDRPRLSALDAELGVVAELKRRIASLPLASQKKVLGENVLRFYGIAP